MSCPDVLTTVYGKAPTRSPLAGALDEEDGCTGARAELDVCSCDVMVSVCVVMFKTEQLKSL